MPRCDRDPVAPVNRLFPWRSCIGACWLAGTFVWTAWLMCHVYRFRRVLRRARRASVELQSEAEALARRLGLATCPTVWLVPGAVCPMVWGLGRRLCLLFPSGLVPRLDVEGRAALLAHELAHEMLHHQKGEPRLPKTVIETQAEAVAYVVCRGVGLETNSAAADYIQLYNGDKKTLGESLTVIQETSSKILDYLLPEQNRSPFHEEPGKAFADVAGHSQSDLDRESPTVSTPAAQGPDHSDSISLER